MHARKGRSSGRLTYVTADMTNRSSLFLILPSVGVRRGVKMNDRTLGVMERRFLFFLFFSVSCLAEFHQ